jgi:uncharacterized membrane protein
MTGDLWMRILHFAGFTLWVAGLVSVAMLLRARVNARTAGILADAGATLAVASGLYTAITRNLFTQPWLHLKLTVVAVLIAVHVSLRIKARRGREGGSAALLAATLLLGLTIMWVIVMRPLAR